MKKRILFLLIVILLFFLPQKHLFSMEWYEAYEKARSEISKGQYAKAISLLSEAVREKPNSSSRVRTTGVYYISYYPYYLLGLCYFHLGDYENARRYFDEELRQEVIIKDKEYRDMYEKIQQTDQYLMKLQAQKKESQKEPPKKSRPPQKSVEKEKEPPPVSVKKTVPPSKITTAEPPSEKPAKKKSAPVEKKKEEVKKTEPVSKRKTDPSTASVQEDKTQTPPVKKPEKPPEKAEKSEQEIPAEIKPSGEISGGEEKETAEKKEGEISEFSAGLSEEGGAESVAPFTSRLRNIGEEINYIIEVGREYIVVVDGGLPVARKANQPFVRIMEEGNHEVLIKVDNEDVFAESLTFSKGYRYVTRIEADEIASAGTVGEKDDPGSSGSGREEAEEQPVFPGTGGGNGISPLLIILPGAALLIAVAVFVVLFRRRQTAAAGSFSTAPAPPVFPGETSVPPVLKEQTGYEGSFAGYTLRNELSSTEMSKLYVVTPKGKKQEYILKIPNMERYGPEAKKQLLDEARLSRSLLNPNIIAIHDVGEYRGIPYYVMEFFKGVTLRELLKRSTVLDIELAVDITISTCLALEYAHKSQPPVIHKDIKPENIMLKVRDNRLEEAKVIDFGISAVESKGRVMGSPRYISPEQMFEGRADPCSDIYSLGVVLYETVLGHLPLKGRNFTQIEIELRDYIQNNKRIVVTVELDPPELKEIIEKMVQISADQRYQSVSEVIHDLRKVKFKYF